MPRFEKLVGWIRKLTQPFFEMVNVNFGKLFSIDLHKLYRFLKHVLRLSNSFCTTLFLCRILDTLLQGELVLTFDTTSNQIWFDGGWIHRFFVENIIDRAAFFPAKSETLEFISLHTAIHVITEGGRLSRGSLENSDRRKNTYCTKKNHTTFPLPASQVV